MPLQRRLPKRGFTNIFKKRFAVVNLRDLAKLDPAEAVTPAPAAKAAVKPDGKAPKPAKVGRKQRAEAAKGKASEKAEAKKTAATKSKAAKTAKK